MAKVHFAPSCAIKYVGSKAKVFNTSVARPKPVLKKGDIIIVDKRTSFNLVTKGFGEFVEVDAISFSKADTANEELMQNLKDELEAYKSENNALFNKNVALTQELTALQNGN